MKNKKYSMGERKAFSPVLQNSTKYFVMLTIVLVLGVFAYQGMAAEETSVSYSELLKQAVEVAYSATPGGPSLWGGFSRHMEQLGSEKAVPFLLDVIENGPDWQEEYRGSKRLFSHLARCYAVLCLAHTKDERAYSVLSGLLENGILPIDMAVLKEEMMQEQIHRAKTLREFGSQLFVSDDPNSVAAIAEAVRQDIEEKNDIRQFAATGLGFLQDSRAVNGVIAALDSNNSGVRRACMFALAKLDDMRSIGPILDAASKYGEDGFILNEYMEKMTKYHVKREIGKENTVSFPGYPELGIYPLEGKRRDTIYLYFWNRWHKNGKELNKRKFDQKYAALVDIKRTHPDNNGAISVSKREIAELGVSVLPLIVQKVKQGQTDLIPLVAELTDNKVSPDAKAEDVAKWWQENKEKWIIFDFEVD